jgi:molecular chaperone GrpE
MKNEHRDKRDSHDASGDPVDFYRLLDELLPVGSQVLRETLAACEKPLKEKAHRARDNSKRELDFEKEKVKCLLELLGIAIQNYQRISADYVNFQRRVTKQTSDTVAYEKERVIKSLLPALDNFEHTLAKSHATESVDAVIEGVRIIYDQMMDILKGHGVEQIQALNEAFDPMQHEAMMQQEDHDKEDGVVLEEFQKGYRLHGRVIRPSRVIVNKTTSQEASPGEEAPEAASNELETSDDDETTDTE